MKKYIYPAIFHPEEVGGFSVSFPDLPGCFTEGDTIEESFEMAKDALGIYLSHLEDNDLPIPLFDGPKAIKENEMDFVALIEMDMTQYRKEHNNKAVKKTLTIPQWLNIRAEREGINFSSVLQEALKERLGA
jgi:predicted RNase H-like HicB family nuclease